MSCVLLSLICIIVLNFISASDLMDDHWSRRLKDELVIVGHMIDVPPPSDRDKQSLVRQGLNGSACQDAVTQLTDAVTNYTDCMSLNVMNSCVCETCVDDYLKAAALVAVNFSVWM